MKTSKQLRKIITQAEKEGWIIKENAFTVWVIYPTKFKRFFPRGLIIFSDGKAFKTDIPNFENLKPLRTQKEIKKYLQLK